MSHIEVQFSVAFNEVKIKNVTTSSGELSGISLFVRNIKWEYNDFQKQLIAYNNLS